MLRNHKKDTGINYNPFIFRNHFFKNTLLLFFILSAMIRDLSKAEGLPSQKIKTIETEIDVYPSGYSAAPDSFYFNQAPARQKSRELTTLNSLINEVIIINANYKQAPHPLLPLVKANQLIEEALPKAIQASGALLALQSLQGSGKQLTIEFLREKDENLLTITHVSLSLGRYLPMPAPGTIVLSPKLLAEQNFKHVSLTLANELAHFRSLVILTAAFFPPPQIPTSHQINSLSIKPCITQTECKQLTTVILTGMSNFWNLPERKLKNYLEAPFIYDMVIRIMNYKIPPIEKLISTMKDQLTGNKKTIFLTFLNQLKDKQAKTPFYNKQNKYKESYRFGQCDSDIASLIVILPEGNNLFSDWHKYHEELGYKYLSHRPAALSSRP